MGWRRLFTLPNLILFAVLVVAAYGAVVYVRQQQEQARLAAQAAIRQEVVSRGDIVATVNATGNLASQESADLYFTAASPQPVADVLVTVGQAVEAGQVLARLDDRSLALAVAEAEQALQAAELNLQLLQAPPRPEDIAVAEANLRVARNEVYAAGQGKSPEEVEIARLTLVLAQNQLNQTYATMDRLVAEGKWAEKNALQAQADRLVEEAQIADLRYKEAQQPPPDGQVSAAQAGVEQAEAALARLLRGPRDEDVQIAELQISQAQAALEIARYDLAQAELVAPFAGVVAAVNLSPGEPASAALPAVVLTDPARFYLDVAVDEVDIAQVAVGQSVTITLDALPNLLLPARVEKIAPTADVNAGVVSYPVRLTLQVEDAAAGVRAGMTATAAIVVREVHAAVLVPNWAIRRDRETGQAFVGLLRDGSIEDVPVEFGLRGETYSEVLAGVAEGDVVAVDTSRQEFQLLGGQ